MNQQNIKEILLKFLQNQKLLVVATVDENKEPYVTNVYMGIDSDFKIHFVSPDTALHSRHILENPKVAFSTVWFDKNNHENRKGIQGKGVCRIVESDTEIKTGVKLHNKNYPEFASRITFDYIKDNPHNSKVWVIEPAKIKYFDDENLGEERQAKIEFN